MPEEQQPESTRPVPPKGVVPHRRGRRGGRGRRRSVSAIPVSGQPVQSEPPAKHTEPPIRLREEKLVRPTPSNQQFASPAPDPIEPPQEKFRPVPRKGNPDVSAISRAVNEVMQIIESLRETLEQMEDVLELVEHAERQKITDEREIESLLRALRQLQSRAGRPDRTELGERRSLPFRPDRPQRSEHQSPPEQVERPESPESAEQPEGQEPQQTD